MVGLNRGALSASGHWFGPWKGLLDSSLSAGVSGPAGIQDLGSGVEVVIFVVCQGCLRACPGSGNGQTE